ncbi:diguanylate cyclase [Nitrogeniibacter mangrovi]|uniref:diguanylate cyclase n=1 Tax=Nitrogeniibacter mangrovi TaxID=2016596 RepID=A0A6C1B061_9RHOO|nr:diguanylate cyclase [Nitrogeniibacter mangrovi]QID16379.1 diguanylate cyclase [Nitrogeniibacter mangrovi]
MDESKPRVLIVDDERSNINILGNLLVPEFDVVVATDGAAALNRAFAEQRPDLILLDVMMPGMDGYEVCRRLKADEATRDIPVIFISAMGEEDDEALGLQIGAVDYVTKPFSPPILKMRIRTHVELKRLRDHWQRLSTVDGLTQIANRRAFDEALASAWRCGIRLGHPLALILADVDHFKAYNDHHGHAEGDRCLYTVAQALAAQTKRACDTVARYGGEEFVCLMPGVDLAGAQTVAQRMGAAVAEAAIPHRHPIVDGTVSISIGVAVVVPSVDLAPEVLLVEADRRLYEAKRAGRNRLCAGSVDAPG